jgi:preprotein translocase subunit SecF
MEQFEHESPVNEKKILAIGGIIILVVIVVIAYFEWTGRRIY